LHEFLNFAIISQRWFNVPRTGRKRSESGIYHIVLRGSNRQTIFEDEEDATKFLETLQRYMDISGYKLYDYCLMGNHVHLLLKEEQEELGIVMRRIGASYVYWYNLKYQRCGHLFQDRYKSEPVEDDRYFLTVLRYIHQNPLKAGIVNDIADYKWSSYPEYMGSSKMIETDFALQLFNDDKNKAIASFAEFHEIARDDTCLDMNVRRRILDEEAIGVIKTTCNLNQCSDVQGLERDKRDRYLKALKEKGLSTRQLARLTGISRNIILKA
jgi:putative transposase